MKLVVFKFYSGYIFDASYAYKTCVMEKCGIAQNNAD